MRIVVSVASASELIVAPVLGCGFELGECEFRENLERAHVDGIKRDDVVVCRLEIGLCDRLLDCRATFGREGEFVVVQDKVLELESTVSSGHESLCSAVEVYGYISERGFSHIDNALDHCAGNFHDCIGGSNAILERSGCEGDGCIGEAGLLEYYAALVLRYVRNRVGTVCCGNGCKLSDGDIYVCKCRTVVCGNGSPYRSGLGRRSVFFRLPFLVAGCGCH